jgi:CRP/FNR family cyclic AMP-dependent transcriptional regulator
MEIGLDLELVEKIPFFKKLWPAELQCILGYTTTHVLAYGDILFKQGDPPNGLYILLEGKLQVILQGNRVGSPIAVSEVLPGQYVGEFGVFDGKPRSASVKAQLSSKLLFLPSKAFEVMIITQPTIARYVLGNLCDLVIDQVHDKIKKEDVWNMIKAKNLRPDMKNMKILCEIIRENNKTLTGITSKGNGVLFRTQKSQGSA